MHAPIMVQGLLTRGMEVRPDSMLYYDDPPECVRLSQVLIRDKSPNLLQ
jgi:hypothetical protein